LYALAKDIRTVVTGEISPDKKAELDSKLIELESSVKLAQLKVNESEARASSLFVSGWRPSIGWVCSLGLLYQFVIYPFLLWANLAFKWNIASPPALNTEILIPLVTGMLGMGSLRTFDKLKGNG